MFKLGMSLLGQMVSTSIYLTESVLNSVLPKQTSNSSLFVTPPRDAKEVIYAALRGAMESCPHAPPASQISAGISLSREPAGQQSVLHPTVTTASAPAGPPGWGPMP